MLKPICVNMIKHAHECLEVGGGRFDYLLKFRENNYIFGIYCNFLEIWLSSCFVYGSKGVRLMYYNFMTVSIRWKWFKFYIWLFVITYIYKIDYVYKWNYVYKLNYKYKWHNIEENWIVVLKILY